MVIAIIAAVVVLIVLIFVVMYNGFVRANNDCEEAYSTMDVYMKKRYDLIPNLVETVKGYASHEKETLQKVIEARNFAQGATTVEDKIAGENALTGTLKSLFAISEAYPDLKANTNFLDLQNQLKSIEEDIANSRKYYNAVVKLYNNKCQVFPSNIIGQMFNFKLRQMFQVDSEEERRNVKVSFNA
ncbi:hypothetical protein AXF21_04665 [Eubacterium minutum ATCC 700079]|nr:hypothetical protein AXF21_04665 [Eubacterium minutum ATCC 700079]